MAVGTLGNQAPLTEYIIKLVTTVSSDVISLCFIDFPNFKFYYKRSEPLYTHRHRILPLDVQSNIIIL